MPVISSSITLWVPTYVHRNDKTGGWQIVFKHAQGRYRGWVGDNGRPMEVSLAAAWQHLVEALSRHHPPVRTTPNRGRPRIFDTGMPGVLIERKRGSVRLAHGVLVRVAQRVTDDIKGSKVTHVNTFYVREPEYLKDPEFNQTRFRRSLCEAIALRRLYEKTVNISPIDIPLQLTDVSDKEIPANPLVELDLGVIFSSFNADSST